MKKNNIQPWALFLPELKELIEDKNFNELKKLLKGLHPVDLAEGWDKFSPTEKLVVFKLLDIKRAIEIFEELDFNEQTYILNNLEDTSISELLTDMASDEKAKLFKNLPDRIRKKMSALLKKEDFEVVRKIAEYPEHTAGRLMSTDFITLAPHLTAKHSLEKIQASARLHRIVTIYAIYVLDEKNSLIGGVTLRRLISAPQDIKISEIMSPVQLIKIKATADQEDVAKLFSKYDLTAAPVVDDENHLIGVITIDDVVDVINQEATEDMTKMAGTSPKELTKLSAFGVTKLRFPWLIATCFGEILVSHVIKYYNPTLQSIIALASFSPLIAAMGNNVGTQSSTISVRALATGEVKDNEIWRVGFLELKVGIFMGLFYGVFAGIVSFFMYPALGLKFALVIVMAMTAALTVASTAGGIEPFLFRKIGVDPATATGPLIATFTDIVGVTTYLGLATWLLI
ncbi:MAG: magnesium transporter [Elusimicrobiota bacterium]